MSKKDFEEMMMVGSLRQALNDVRDKLGIDLTVQIPADKSKLFNELQKKYDDFYKMSVEQRFAYSGYLTTVAEEDK